MSQGIVKKEGDWVRLWVNPNPSQTMGSQTIVLPEANNVSRYGVLVIYNNTNPISQGFWEADPEHVAYVYSQSNVRANAVIGLYHRRFSFSNGNCVIGDIFYHNATQNTYVKNASGDTGRLIPLEIWGILKS